jgi:hypothetical protein
MNLDKQVKLHLDAINAITRSDKKNRDVLTSAQAFFDSVRDSIEPISDAIEAAEKRIVYGGAKVQASKASTPQFYMRIIKKRDPLPRSISLETLMLGKKRDPLPSTRKIKKR